MVAGGVLALSLGVAAWWAVGGAGPSPIPPVEAATTQPVAAPRPETVKPSIVNTWRTKRDRILAAQARRRLAVAVHDRGQADDAGPDRCSEDCWGNLQMQLRLAGVASGCRELLPPDAVGEVRFEAHVFAEPQVGAVVASVDVLDDDLELPEFNECVQQSARMAELVEPEDAVADRFVFRYSAGPGHDNAVDFLEDHPEVVDKHPRLAALLSRDPAAPASDDDATAFAQVVSTDPAATESFLRWMTEQGPDLSHVRVEP